MATKKSIWTSVTGGVTSAAPILFACCKSGACVGVCASPIASLFGISSATLASSPWMGVAEPVLIAASAVSFTVSYYTLYVLPKLAACGPGDCGCEPTASEKRKNKIAKFVFWFGLILSIGFLSYFEYSKYQAANAPTDCETECAPGKCSTESEESLTSSCDSTTSCCDGEEVKVENAKSPTSEITCPECGNKKMETLPTEVCQLAYTCEKCNTVMHPKDGDCCVFCSYGDHKCPSKQ